MNFTSRDTEPPRRPRFAAHPLTDCSIITAQRPAAGIRLLFCLCLLHGAAFCQENESAEQHAFVRQKVMPLLESRCGECHIHGEEFSGGLSLRGLKAMLKGGDSGAAVIPGNASESLLIQAVRYESFEMPPRTRMPEAEVVLLEKWINDGAIWPDDQSGDEVPAETDFPLEERRSSHWSWAPVQRPEIPDPSGAEWCRTPVDRFILQKLNEADLQPTADTDRAALLRRLYFDLIGLPPTVSQTDAFVNDPADDQQATESVVDALLDSPQFGERWARHWLDLVRYAETLGHEFDYPLHHAWKYRDYVIRAFNADVPYDQFIREHIAGDLLPEPRRHPTDGFNESVLGTGFWFLGEDKHAPVDVRAEEAARIDNQIDVFSRAFLGLTVACARCHDHKFDAVSTRDYYALAGFLQSSRRAVAWIDPGNRTTAATAELRNCRETFLKALTRSEDRSEVATAAERTPQESDATAAAGVPNVRFSEGMPPGWFLSGEAFSGFQNDEVHRTIHCTEAGPAAVTPGGVSSARLASGLTGVLASPTFELNSAEIHVLASGQNCRARLIIDGYVMNEFSALLFSGALQDINTEGRPAWIRFGGDVSRYQGHRAHLQFEDSSGGWFCIHEIRPAAAGAPLPSLPESSSEHFGEPLKEPAEAWLAAAKDVPTPEPILAMTDGSGEDERIFIRGSHRNPGEPAPRSFLDAIAGPDQPPISEGSGRLALADRMLAESDPFPARVMVNRIWQHLIGEGIVSTPDDFGVMGQPPTHPELLDYLADEFRRDGWSVKRAVRRIVTSRVYRLSVTASPAAEERDPVNRLLHRAHVRRLEGEAIRDAMLSLSGTLSLQQFGPSVPVHLTEFMQGRGRPGSGPLDGHGRRSIYISVNRNFLSPFMLAFDTPAPFTAVGDRSSSNVPAQALMLLNSPFAHLCAERWAERLIEECGSADEVLVNTACRQAFGRPPDELQRTVLTEFLQEASGKSEAVSFVAQRREAVTDLCHVLLNTKQFIFLE